MRTKKTILNSLFGIINNFLSIILKFGIRWFFVRSLDIDYLGLEGLFANVIGVFSLLEMGCGTAFSFSLFKPLHEGDRKQLSAIMRLYKKVYVGIGIAVLSLSILVSAMIGLLVKDTSLTGERISKLFIVYSISVVIYYFFSNKRTLIFAAQQAYKLWIIDAFTKIIVGTIQLIAIISYKSYDLYLYAMIVGAVFSNLAVSIIVKRSNLYDEKCKEYVPREYINELKHNIKRIIVNNLAWTGISSTDNIIISSTTGSKALASNANYSSIINSITGLASSFLSGANASIGDLLVENEDKRKKQYFERYNFIYQAIAAYLALGLFFVSKPFITLWVGENFLFANSIVFFLSLNLFLALIFEPLGAFQNYSGLYVKYTPYSIIALFINLLFSIVLSLRYGIIGVFIGTTITYMFMIFIVSRILHAHLFDCKRFYLVLMKIMVVAFFSFWGITFFNMEFNNTFINILVKALYVTLLYWFLFFLFFRKSDLYKYYKDILLHILKKHKRLSK